MRQPRAPRVLFFKAHIEGYTRKDGTFVAPHDDKRPTRREPTKAIKLITEDSRVGPRVPIRVRRVPQAVAPSFHVDEHGQAWLTAQEGAWLPDRLFRLVDAYLNPLPPNTFIRMHHKAAEDIAHLAAGRHHGSKNHATGESEGGLSVATSPEFPADHGYYVTGSVVGQGSDSEPLLDTASAKPASKLMSVRQITADYQKRYARRLRELGLSEGDARLLRSGQYFVVKESA